MVFSFRTLCLAAGVFALLVSVLPDRAAATALGDLRRDAEHYRCRIERTRVETTSRGELPSPLVSYLEFARREAESLLAFSEGRPPEPVEVARRVRQFSRERLVAAERWIEAEGLSGQTPYRLEQNAWQRFLAPYLQASFLRRLVLERALLERRNHDYDFPASANFAEVFVNRRLDVLDYRREPRWFRLHGVSRLESDFGVEPMVLLEQDNSLGLMLAAGVLYNFFPRVEQRDDNRFLPQARHAGWWQRTCADHLQKVGLRLGAGILFDRPSAAFGLGLRLRAMTVWGVYSPGKSDFSVALGFSSLEWLKKLNLVTPLGG